MTAALYLPVSKAAGTSFRVLFSEGRSHCFTGWGADRVRFARFVEPPRAGRAAGPVAVSVSQRATASTFFLEEKKSVVCADSTSAACGKPVLFGFSIGQTETVVNLTERDVLAARVPLPTGLRLPRSGFPQAAERMDGGGLAGEYNRKRLCKTPSNTALSAAGVSLLLSVRSFAHEHVAPVGNCGAGRASSSAGLSSVLGVEQLSIGRDYEGADIFSPLAACGSAAAAGDVVGALPGHCIPACVVLAGVQCPGSVPGAESLWRRAVPAVRVSPLRLPRRLARSAVLGLAVLVAGTLTSCTTIAPVVRCVPGSVVLPCK